MSLGRAVRSPAVAASLAGGICLSAALLAGAGLSANRRWEESARMLIERRTEEAATTLLTALVRDMGGAQLSVLSSSIWEEVTQGSANDVSELVATAFSRYPYPEAFFVDAAGGELGHLQFFTRSTRPPPWAPASEEESRYPVRLTEHSSMAEVISRGIQPGIEHGRRLTVFETELNGVAYQVVARLRYRDQSRQSVSAVFGFVVNLPWVRTNYFPELTHQVARIGGSDSDLALAIIDEKGVPVVETRALTDTARGSRRQFPLVFLDPSFLPVNALPDGLRTWSVLASGADEPTLRAATYSANLTLMMTVLAIGALAVGLVLIVRTVRANATLADLRADFVASVTHELKTPIAAIRAIGEAFASGRVDAPTRQREYAALIVEETRRLGRLVNNLLAMSRITDVADVYSFEALTLKELVTSTIKTFSHQLKKARMRIELDLPDDLPPIIGDRAALMLVLENLLDNAIRYSSVGSTITWRAESRHSEPFVAFHLSDQGQGIPADEIDRITQRFFRGRNAKAGGSGLGLSIVHRILGDHGGSLEVRSVVGRGTTVTLRLRESNRLQTQLRGTGAQSAS